MSYLEPIEEHELKHLLNTYNNAEVETLQVEIDEELYTNRFMKSSDRRAEVVFAIGMPEGILLHRKSFYGDDVFRLPSGGIDYGESVLDALRREVREETSLRVSAQQLLGVQDCLLAYQEQTVRFVSYIFHVDANGDLNPDPGENIVELRFVSPAELKDVAESLRHAPPPYEGWGRWRALAHELAYRHLAGSH